MVCLVDILRESKKSLGDEGDKGYLDQYDRAESISLIKKAISPT